MDFSFSEEQKMFKENARAFLEKECPRNLAREMEKDEAVFPKDVWRKMAGLGWMGITFPEKYGGVGGDFLDLLILLEEMGRVCLPGPFFSTVVVGGLILLDGGSESQKNKFLAKIADGEIFLTLAESEPIHTQYDPSLITVRAQGEMDGHFFIDGVKLFVPDGKAADYVICVTRTEEGGKNGITLFLVDSRSIGIQRKNLKSVSRDKQSQMTFERVKVSKESILGPMHGGGAILEVLRRKAAVAKCAEMIGGAQFVLDMCVRYAKEREQFGRPIGSFQAVQHHCANMLIGIEGGRYITYKAGWMLSQGKPCTMQVASAKAWVSEAYKRVSVLGHQVMGGTGYMEEHDMPLYSRRAKAAELAFGDANYYKKIVAQEIGLEVRESRSE